MASYSLRQLLIAGLTAAAVIAAIVWWFVASRPQVVAVMPTRGDAAEVVYATGVVEPQQWAKVSSLQRKRILDHCNCEGKEVKRGDVLARLEDGAQHVVVRVVRRRDDDGVDGGLLEQLSRALVDLDALARSEPPPAAALVVRVGDRRHLRSGNEADVPDVLAPHHPGADHPVADDVGHAGSFRSQFVGY